VGQRRPNGHELSRTHAAGAGPRGRGPHCLRLNTAVRARRSCRGSPLRPAHFVCRCGSGDFITQKRLALIASGSSLLRSSIRRVVRRLNSLEPHYVHSVVSHHAAANVDAECRAQIWREQLKASLTDKLSHRQPAATPEPKARDAQDIRAAILGDVYTLETKAKESAVKGQPHPERIMLQQRALRMFYATTNSDAPLERDAIICCVLPAVQPTARRCGIEISFIDVRNPPNLPSISPPSAPPPPPSPLLLSHSAQPPSIVHIACAPPGSKEHPAALLGLWRPKGHVRPNALQSTARFGKMPMPGKCVWPLAEDICRYIQQLQHCLQSSCGIGCIMLLGDKIGTGARVDLLCDQ
jgi:hypothetical protein